MIPQGGLRQDLGVLLHEVVTTCRLVGATSGRSAKVAAIADLLARLDGPEIAPATAFVAGEPRQGKAGVGWATVGSVQVTPATGPGLTVGELDRTLERLGRLSGPGSAAARQALLVGLFGRATEEEGAFIRRLIVGELRQGALTGVVTEAVARAAGVPAEAVRRAVMLSGDLPEVARTALTEGAAGFGRGRARGAPTPAAHAGVTATDLAAALGALGLSSVEWKLDGARIQAHRSGDRGPAVHPQPQRRDRAVSRRGGRREGPAGRAVRARRRGAGRGRRSAPRALPGHHEPLRPP